MRAVVDPPSSVDRRETLRVGLSPDGRPPRATAGGARSVLVAALAGLLGAGALAGGLFAAGLVHRAGGVTTVVERQSAPAASTRIAEPSATRVYAAAAPGVVDITARVLTRVDTPFGPRTESGTATGAGSVIDTRGHILTAEHVVSDATSLSVKLQDGTVRGAKVLGRDSATDIAVLKIDPSGLTLHPLVLGSLRGLAVGDPLYAIGDPFGYARSLSSGLISGLDRTIEAPNGFTVAHAIQTDAAFNPGNSGGPLLDANGRLIGVVDQIATGHTRTETNTGVGFAVPVDVVRSVLTQLEQGATPRHAYLGVGAADGTPTGALVQTLPAGSPAAEAGLKPGDVILTLGGSKIAGVGDLVAAIAAHRPGERVTLTVVRGTKRLTVQVTLATQPSQAS